jgi:hypothetical protein
MEKLAIAPATHTSIVADKRHQLHEYLYNIGEDHRFEEVAPELLKPPEAHYGRTGYTAEQRIWIKQKRDEGLDLAPYKHLTDKERHLHHIWAQAFCQAYLGLSNFPELINHPHNGISLSKIAHVGPYIPNVNHSRHPDVFTAKQAYRDKPDLMRMVFEDHWNMALDGVKYWISDDDTKMFQIATERTNRMRERKLNGKTNL